MFILFLAAVTVLDLLKYTGAILPSVGAIAWLYYVHTRAGKNSDVIGKLESTVEGNRQRSDHAERRANQVEQQLLHTIAELRKEVQALEERIADLSVAVGVNSTLLSRKGPES